MPSGEGKWLDLDCLIGDITVVTKYGIIYQGRIKADDGARPAYSSSHKDDWKKDDCDKDDWKKDDCKKDHCKKDHCPPPHVEVKNEVKYENHPNFICLMLSCVPGIVNPADGIIHDIANSPTPNIFLESDTVLINVADISAVDYNHVSLTEPATA